MRPIPAPRIGDAHGLLRAINQRGRLRHDEFVTEFTLDELFPPGLENALGRTRAVRLLRPLRRAGQGGPRGRRADRDRQALRARRRRRRAVRRLDSAGRVAAPPAAREAHDGLDLPRARDRPQPARVGPARRRAISTLDFGRSLAYLGRAGWDNENTLQIQGERYLILLHRPRADRRRPPADADRRAAALELTLPVHMSLLDIAAQLNPGGTEAVRAAAEEEFAAPAPEPEPEPEPPTVEAAAAAEPEDDDDNGYHTVMSPAAVRPPRRSPRTHRPRRTAHRPRAPRARPPSPAARRPRPTPPSAPPPPSETCRRPPRRRRAAQAGDARRLARPPAA